MAKAARKVEAQKEEEIQPIEEVQEIIEVPSEPIQEGIEIEATIEDIKPVTLTGKTVPLSISGKVRLLNTKTNKIITGLIDQKRAQEQVNQFPHIQIVNESEYVNQTK